ncbi:MAG: tyrosine-type recombinase/integrase [Fimbriimonadaceae bacterium]
MAKKAVAHQGYRYTDERGYFCWRLSLGSRENAKPIVIKRKLFADRERAIKAKLKELAEKGTLTRGSEDKTVKARLTWWLENKIEQSRQRRTYISYELTCRRHIFPVVGNVKVTKLTPDHVQTVISHVKRKSLSDRSAQYAVLVLLRGLPRREATLLRASLADSDVSVPNASKPRDRVLDHAEIDAVLRAAYAQAELRTRPGEFRFLWRDRFLLDFLLNSGLRISEALGLLVFDVDRKRQGIQISKQLEWGKDKKTGAVTWDLKDRTKTGDDRFVPLTDQALAAIDGQLTLLADEQNRAGDGYENHGLLFPTSSGRPMHQRNVLRSLTLIIRRARVKNEDGFEVAVPHATLHDLRRSFGTHFANAEPRMHIISAVLGHKNLQTTKKFYVHAKHKEMSEALANLKLGSRSKTIVEASQEA